MWRRNVFVKILSSESDETGKKYSSVVVFTIMPNYVATLCVFIGLDAAMFVVDAKSGNLTLNGSLDRETHILYKVKIKVFDDV